MLLVRFVTKSNTLLGKTTILYNFKLNEIVDTMPTIGFNVENFQYRKLSMTAWDIGGQDKIRPLWQHYFTNTDAIIFVVDSADGTRIAEAKQELHKVLSHEALQRCKVLIYANKQDLPNALNAQQVAAQMGLNSLRQDWYVQPCVGKSVEGLYEGLDWLNNKL